VAGVVCCGIALGWLLVHVGALTLMDLGWLLPTILIGAGVLGVGLSLQRSRNRSRIRSR
jgi:hypothetical protein